MRFVSYNLKKNNALAELPGLVRRTDPDFLCLQEVEPETLDHRIGNMELAVATSRNRLGLAIFVNQEKWVTTKTGSFRLEDSHYDRIATPAHERLLGAVAENRADGVTVAVGSLHASPLTAMNRIRRRQITTAAGLLRSLGGNSPSMMLGDFNYPLLHGALSHELHKIGQHLYTPASMTYNHLGVKGVFDFAAGEQFSRTAIQTLRQGVSDHIPIMLDAEIQ